MSDLKVFIDELIAEGHSKRTLANILADRCKQNGTDPAQAHQLLLELWEEKARGLSPELQSLLEAGVSMAKTDTWPPDYDFRWEEHQGSIRVPLGKVKSRAYTHTMMWGRWDESPLDGISQKEWPKIMEEWRRSGFSGTIDTGGTDFNGQLIQGLKRFFDQQGEGTEYSDIQSGSYLKAKNKGTDCYIFLPTSRMLHFLKSATGKEVTPDKLEFALRQVGLRVGYKEVNPQRIGKQGTLHRGLWVIPVERLDAYGAGVVEPEKQEELIPNRDENNDNLSDL